MRPIAIMLLLTATTAVAAQDGHDTRVPRTQIAAVVRDVAGWHDRQHPDCRFKKMLGSSVIEATPGESTEKWTIAGCDGREFSYQVFVMSQDDGGVADMVSNLDDAPVTSAGTDAAKPLDAAACAARNAEADRLLASDKREDIANGVAMAADIAASTCPQPAL